jgi:hypothetical protein
MKNLLAFLLFMTASNYLFSQNYNFKQKDELFQYTNSKGEFVTKLENTSYGNYKIEFELDNINGKPLFTEYNNNEDMGYYMLLEQNGFQEQKGKIYEVSYYYSTVTRGRVLVLFSKDKKSLVIFKNGKIIEYK